MTKRKKQVTEKTLIVSESNNRCSSYGGEIQYFDLITLDLIIKILSKLPSAKSMAQCRCVSKLWSSIISRPNYKELFPTKSPEPPRFLFTFIGEGKLFFYTSPQPQNPDDNLSLVATRHHRNSVTIFYRISRPIHGLVCHHRTRESCKEVVISNPITGQSVTLPTKVTTPDIFQSRSYLGYDPIDKQFKVLCISWPLRGTEKKLSLEHQVLTLENGSKNLLWRKIECCIPYYALDNEICINGVLYYKASLDYEHMIGCFDIRSERLDFISGRPSTLVNYKGKLGAADNSDYKDFVLWVLEDSEEQKWSKYIYEKPFQWQQELNSIDADGVTNRGEVVFISKNRTEFPLYIFYYNLEKNIVVKVIVEVPPFQTSKWCSVYTFPNYVEDVKLM